LLEQEPVEPSRRAAGNDGDFDDLPDVPDGPDDPSGGGAGGGDGPMGSDEDAVRQIRRRVSPVGWVAILAVLVVGGGTAWQLTNTAIREAREERENSEGTLELNRILQQTIPNTQKAEQVRAIYSRFQSPDVRARARRLLSGLKDQQAIPMLIEGLDRPGGSRTQAAQGIAEIGLPAGESAKPRLLAALRDPTTDPLSGQVEVAWALVVLNETAAWPKIRELVEAGRLQGVVDLDGRRVFDPALVARLAGKQRLVELAASNNNASKRLAALSLAELATPDLIDPLSNLSHDSDLAVSREAAIGLGRTGDPRASDAIMAFLTAHPDERSAVLGALASSAGAAGLGVVIHGARDLRTRADATRMLREQHDPDAGDALFEALGAATATDDVSQEMKRNAVFGLAEIGDPRSVDGLMEYATFALTHQDPNSTQNGKLALDQLRRIPGAGDRAKVALMAMLRDPHGDFARTPTLLALATATDLSVASAITPFMTNPDSQDGAIAALCSMHHPDCLGRVVNMVKMPAGLHMVEETARDEPVHTSRRNAIRGLAWVGLQRQGAPALNAQGRAAAVRELRKIVEDPNDRRGLRELAGDALAAVADEATLNDIATRATDTAVPEETRLYYLVALRSRATPQIANRLVQTYLKRGANFDLMKTAAITIGFSADESTTELLIPMLSGNDAADANLRFCASVAAIIGGNARAATALVDQLLTNDELAGTLQNEFAPRSATPGATTATENWNLLALTPAMFADGRVYRRIEVASILNQGRGAHTFPFALTWITNRLRAGWESARGMTPQEVRSTLRTACMETDAFRRDQSFRALRALTDRGSLLSLRRQTRVPEAAERARREILAMSGNNN
jgi:HEAT repeat protein